jgi:hypothetical protein
VSAVSDPESKGKLYRTSDIYFSSYLCAIDFPLKTTEFAATTNGSRKVVFVFSISDSDLNKAKALYFGGTGTVKARVFVDHLRSLKSICFT